MPKVFVFGIDGAAPSLIFKEWLPELPTIRKLLQQGIHARLNSTIPPSTIVAWSSMFSGKDTSEIGIFSFTYKDKEGKTQLVDSRQVSCDRLWDILSKQQKKSVVLHVPITYPVNPIDGVMVSCFLSPGLTEQSAYPARITEKIRALGDPDMFFDVAVGLARHKALPIAELLKNVYAMTEKQITLAQDLLQHEPWEFFVYMCIGTDRLQHMLWRHFDTAHRRFIKESPHKDALKNYYIHLDQKLAEMLRLLPPDVNIMVVSDHGMVKQEGKININNWLLQKGYLMLTKEAQELVKKEKTRFKFEYVDFARSKVYAAGAYNARVFLNKELLGSNFEAFQEQLIRELQQIPDDLGNPLQTYVYKKEDIYKKPEHEECPNLTVYFDDLRWASNPDLGQEGLYSWESAVGADSAGHARQGIFILSGPQVTRRGDIGEIDLRQIAPTLLGLLQVTIPKDIEVKPIRIN